MASVDNCDFRAGDIVFRRPCFSTFSELIEHGDPETVFADLAALSQTIPYVFRSDRNGSTAKADYKPWHHVEAIVSCDGVLHLLGFDADEPYSNAENVNPVIDSRLLDEDKLCDQRNAGEADLLRMDELVGDELVQGLLKRQGSHYSIAGLFAFAKATEMRIQPAGPLRDRLYREAYAHARASFDSALDTCTTAIARSVIDAQIPLTLVEPDPPVLPAAGLHTLSLLKRLRALLGRTLDSQRVFGAQPFTGNLDPAQLRLKLELLADVMAQPLVGFDPLAAGNQGLGAGIDLDLPRLILGDPQQTFDAFIRGLPMDGTVAAPGGLIETTAAYLDLLERASDLLSVGVGSTVTPPIEQSPVLSPAMLWDGLLGAGFHQV